MIASSLVVANSIGSGVAELFWQRVRAPINTDGFGFWRASIGSVLPGDVIERILINYWITFQTSPLNPEYLQVRSVLWGVIKLNPDQEPPAGVTPGGSPHLDWLLSSQDIPHYNIINYAVPHATQQDMTYWGVEGVPIQSQGRRLNETSQQQGIWWLGGFDFDSAVPPSPTWVGNVWAQILVRGNSVSSAERAEIARSQREYSRSLVGDTPTIPGVQENPAFRTAT